MTPFGRPVVPEVNIRSATTSGSGAQPSGGRARPRAGQPATGPGSSTTVGADRARGRSVTTARARGRSTIAATSDVPEALDIGAATTPIACAAAITATSSGPSFSTATTMSAG